MENLIVIIYVFLFVTGIGYDCYFKAIEETCAGILFILSGSIYTILCSMKLENSNLNYAHTTLE